MLSLKLCISDIGNIKKRLKLARNKGCKAVPPTFPFLTILIFFLPLKLHKYVPPISLCPWNCSNTLATLKSGMNRWEIGAPCQFQLLFLSFKTAFLPCCLPCKMKKYVPPISLHLWNCSDSLTTLKKAWEWWDVKAPKEFQTLFLLLVIAFLPCECTNKFQPLFMHYSYKNMWAIFKKQLKLVISDAPSQVSRPFLQSQFPPCLFFAFLPCELDHLNGPMHPTHSYLRSK